ncbi:MAG: enoyl-ACP reductase FabI [Chlorobiales bacterium]
MSEQKSYGLLKGKKGIVFGPLDESSIGWSIALAAHREGAQLAISNIAIAQRVGKVNQLCQMLSAPFIQADASNIEDVMKGFSELKEQFGKIDFIVHSIGMSQNIRKGKPYDDLNYEWYQKTLDVSGLSLHKVVTAALRQDILNDYGSIVALTYIAAQRAYSGYTDMADAKALLESIVRGYGQILGKKGIRINTVSQSPTYTRAGSGIENFDLMYEHAHLLAPLGNATAEECADYIVTLLSDLTRKVTMQNLYHDGGYSSIGSSLPILRVMHEALKNDDIVAKSGLEEVLPPHLRDGKWKLKKEA